MSLVLVDWHLPKRQRTCVLAVSSAAPVLALKCLVRPDERRERPIRRRRRLDVGMARSRSAMAIAILRAVGAFGCKSPGIRHPSSNSTKTYGNPASSRIRRRRVRSTSSSRLNWGTTMRGVAPRAVASAAVARSTSHVTAMPRSIVVSRRYGTMSIASDISLACGTAGSQINPGPRCGRLSSRFRPRSAVMKSVTSATGR